MSQLKLYKKFYSIELIKTGSTIDENFVLINPNALSANTYVAGQNDIESTTIIETGLQIFQDSTGVYYANLNSFLYASDVTYDLVWFVNYTSNAPTKKINTRFRMNVKGVSNQLEIEVLGKYF